MRAVGYCRDVSLLVLTMTASPEGVILVLRKGFDMLDRGKFVVVHWRSTSLHRLYVEPRHNHTVALSGFLTGGHVNLHH